MLKRISFTSLILVCAVLGILFIIVANAEKKNELPNLLSQPNDNSTITQQEEEIIATDLEVPWAMTFLPNGDMLITERPGRVRLLTKDGTLAQTPIATITDVKAIGEGGLMGIAVHPQFNSNKYIYLYYTYAADNNNNTKNRVVRYTLQNNSLSNRTVVVDNIPGAINHNGGRIKFGPDGYLYITTGDAQNPSLAPDKNSLAGKILRVTDDGSPAPGNPFNNRVYTYGHRNSQGLAWDGMTLYETEHGPSAPSCCDEINRLEAGKNYGWPDSQGEQVKTGTEKPLLQSGNSSSDTWAPGGTAFYNGSLFFGGLRGQTIYEYQPETGSLKKYFENQYGRIRDVIVGPDNRLYIATSNRDGRGDPHDQDDKIIRLNIQ